MYLYCYCPSEKDSSCQCWMNLSSMESMCLSGVCTSHLIHLIHHLIIRPRYRPTRASSSYYPRLKIHYYR